jgi:dihydroceramide fatty acyl 2-hydroxylase
VALPPTGPPAVWAKIDSVTGNPSQRDDHTSRAELLQASPPIFRSGTLDRLTRVHPVVPPLVFGPAIVALAGLAVVDDMALSRVLVAFLAGWLFWTFCEYWTHRTVFHFEPERGLGARLHWMVHGVHHDHPNDPLRLVLPPAVSIPLGAAFLGIFLLALGERSGSAVCAGFYSGYLVYDMLHFALHHHRPKTRIFRLLHQLHMRHHFEDEHRGFGVSAPWWDLVFGTYSARARTPRSQADSPGSQRRN